MEPIQDNGYRVSSSRSSLHTIGLERGARGPRTINGVRASGMRVLAGSSTYDAIIVIVV